MRYKFIGGTKHGQTVSSPNPAAQEIRVQLTDPRVDGIWVEEIYGIKHEEREAVFISYSKWKPSPEQLAKWAAEETSASK